MAFYKHLYPQITLLHPNAQLPYFDIAYNRQISCDTIFLMFSQSEFIYESFFNQLTRHYNKNIDCTKLLINNRPISNVGS